MVPEAPSAAVAQSSVTVNDSSSDGLGTEAGELGKQCDSPQNAAPGRSLLQLTA